MDVETVLACPTSQRPHEPWKRTKLVGKKRTPLRGRKTMDEVSQLYSAIGKNHFPFEPRAFMITSRDPRANHYH